jgi:hypothetical protein
MTAKERKSDIGLLAFIQVEDEYEHSGTDSPLRSPRLQPHTRSPSPVRNSDLETRSLIAGISRPFYFGDEVNPNSTCY